MEKEKLIEKDKSIYLTSTEKLIEQEKLIYIARTKNEKQVYVTKA